jgi:hypothetical protein
VTAQAAAHVGTRDARAITSHAQKWFIKQCLQVQVYHRLKYAKLNDKGFLERICREKIRTQAQNEAPAYIKIMG